MLGIALFLQAIVIIRGDLRVVSNHGAVLASRLLSVEFSPSNKKAKDIKRNMFI